MPVSYVCNSFIIEFHGVFTHRLFCSDMHVYIISTKQNHWMLSFSSITRKFYILTTEVVILLFCEYVLLKEMRAYL